jgi:muramoyltetrapeptide carboxypeptidase
MIHYPAPLRAGARIAITAPSSGVEAMFHPRLELALGRLRSQGFQVVEGRCLRDQVKSTSGTKEERAAELWGFLTDPGTAAIYPPWGGERAIDLLPLIDFERLRSLPPKWLIGFSDISTLQVPLTLISGWATAHASCLLEVVPKETHPLTSGILTALGTETGRSFTQHSSLKHQAWWADYAAEPHASLNLTEPTLWKRLDGRLDQVVVGGRLIGGCIETVSRILGTRFGDVPAFVRNSGKDGTILYLESSEYKPTEMLRALTSFRLHGWFSGINALVLGRNAGIERPDPTQATFRDVLTAVLGDLPFPVIYDVDIGHRPPQFTLINGAVAKITYESGGGSVTQTLA